MSSCVSNSIITRSPVIWLSLAEHEVGQLDISLTSNTEKIYNKTKANPFNYHLFNLSQVEKALIDLYPNQATSRLNIPVSATAGTQKANCDTFQYDHKIVEQRLANPKYFKEFDKWLNDLVKRNGTTEY